MDINDAFLICHEYERSIAHSNKDRGEYIGALHYIGYYYYDRKDWSGWEHTAYSMATYYYCNNLYEPALKYFKDVVNYGSDYYRAEASVDLAKYYFYAHDNEPDMDTVLIYCDHALKLNPNNQEAEVMRLAAKGFLEENGMTMKEYSDAVFELFNKLKKLYSPGSSLDPLPEIELLVIELLLNKELIEPAHDLAREARDLMADRLLSSEDPDDLTLMFNLISVDPIPTIESDLDIYDLTRILYDCKAALIYKDVVYVASAEERDDDEVIKFNGKYYQNPYDFIRNATIEGIRLNRIADSIEVNILNKKDEV